MKIKNCLSSLNWNFKEQLTDLELIEPIFNLFLKELDKLGLVLNEGRIIDASFIEMLKQRNSREKGLKVQTEELIAWEYTKII